MTVAWATTTLPPAYIGQAYEASLAASGLAGALTVSAGTDVATGLPAGLSINADNLRITGTPTGAASTPQNGGTAQSGPGAYTVSLSNGTTHQNFTVNLFASQTDPSAESSLSVATQSTVRNLK